MTILLNIGLNTPSGDPVSAHTVLTALRVAGLPHRDVGFHASDSEETVVAALRVNFNDLLQVITTGERLYDTAAALGQDCIAVYDDETGRGSLIGPRAHEWGEFDPAKFLLLDGSRAA